MLCLARTGNSYKWSDSGLYVQWVGALSGVLLPGPWNRAVHLCGSRVGYGLVLRELGQTSEFPEYRRVVRALPQPREILCLPSGADSYGSRKLNPENPEGTWPRWWTLAVGGD